MKILKIKYKIVGLGEREFSFENSSSNCTIIRGENYSGKTVLLSLLNAEAIDKQYLFNKELSGVFSEKTIIIQKDENIFELYSRVTPSGVNCSFKLNEKELCTNGKITTYDQLVKNYGLNQTPEIINQHSSFFFDLSPIERKKFIQENYITDHVLIEKWRTYVNNRSNFLSSKLAEIVIFKTSNQKEEIKTEIENLKIIEKIFNEINTKMAVVKSHIDLSLKVLREPPEQKISNFVYSSLDKEISFEKIGKLQIEQQENEVLLSIKRKILYETSLLIEVPENSEYTILNIEELEYLKRFLDAKQKIAEFKEKNRYISDEPTLDLLSEEPLSTNIEKLKQGINSLTNEAEILSGEIFNKQSLIKNSNSDNPCISPNCLQKMQEEISETTIKKSEILNSIKKLEEQLKELSQKLIEIKEKNKQIKEHNDAVFNYNTELNIMISLLKAIPIVERLKGSTLQKLQEIFNFNKERNIILDKNETIKEKINGIKSSFSNLDNFSIEEIETKISNCKTEIENLKDFINKINLSEKYLVDFNSYLLEKEKFEKNESLKIELLKLQEELNALNFSNERLNELEFKLKTIDSYEKEEIEFKEELDKLLVLKEILHVNGLPKILIQGELLKLENIINENIALYFSKDISIKFDYSDKKLEINIKTKHSPSNTYENLSGAEKSIVKIASSLAFQKDKMNIVRMDEIDAFMDENNRLYFNSFLENLSNNCNQIFCISHNIELLENNRFNVINLSKN